MLEKEGEEEREESEDFMSGGLGVCSTMFTGHAHRVGPSRTSLYFCQLCSTC